MEREADAEADPMDGDAPAQSVLDFATYEDYLAQHITAEDELYVTDPDHACQIVELGYKGKDLMGRDEFLAAREAAAALQEGPLRRRSLDAMCSSGRDLTKYPFLHALAQREELVRSGRLATIIFLRDFVGKHRHEVSAYIDYGHRLKTEDFDEYFSGRKKLLPKPSDLSYYNWRTQALSHNHTATFQVVGDQEGGLQFKHRRDRKVIDVDPSKARSGDRGHRIVVQTTEYAQVVLYDHVPRRKG